MPGATWRASMAANSVSEKPKIVGDVEQELALARVHRAVGLGDVEQGVDHLLLHLGGVGEDVGELAGIGVVAGDRPLGEVEHPAHIGHLLVGHLEHLVERLDFERRHHAVGLGHLGRQRHHADGEGERPRLRVGGAAERQVDDEMAGDAADQRAERAADGEADAGAAELSPDGHREGVLEPACRGAAEAAAGNSSLTFRERKSNGDLVRRTGSAPPFH